MTFSKTIFTALLISSASLATACAANSSESALQAQESLSSYQKPGAAITYSHDLKSQLSAGEIATFKLRLGESYKAGQLIVNLTADGNIVLFPASTSASFDMATESSHEMNISFTANGNGRHYINVEALAVNPSGQSQPRIFLIPVQVGPLVQQKPHPDMKTMDDGGNVINMEAEEEIIVK